MAAVLLCVSILSFLLIKIMPGDAVSLMLGTDASPEQRLELERELHLDKPWPIQYLLWLSDLLQGNFGTSTYYHTGVLEILLRRASVTLFLGGVSLIISSVLGITLGTVSVLRKGTWVEYGINSLATFGISIPNFWVAIVLIYVFAQKLQLLPVQGYTALSEDWVQGLQQLVLPCATISFQPTAAIIRQTRAGLLDTIQQDYIRTAYAKGLSPQMVVRKHMLKNAMIPVLTVISMNIAKILGGSVIAEEIFNIPGMGQLMISGVFNRDIPVIQGSIIVVSFVVLIVMLLANLAYSVADPRIGR